ncbi:Hypothetical protein PHPALM_20357 [Phytophthora palmivora]|uniref:Uncharacterized protein n=1 Tax=Phytophthora palmivora TaxID=4796 RepID=A0A2P4XF38_9STRA|nr:Hypothetical protein PHPALM_20357 [Phytophthora palmivora]
MRLLQPTKRLELHTKLSELNYWYIYDQNYGRQQLTVKSDYVSTKQTWNVARIIQRKPCRSGLMHRALWCHKKSVGGRYYQRTWEPRRVLLEDGFMKELDLVDRWKNAETGRFDDSCRDDEFGKFTIGADVSGLCLFNAFNRAAEVAGRPDIVSQKDND